MPPRATRSDGADHPGADAKSPSLGVSASVRPGGDSRRTLPTHLSAIPFCHGAWTLVRFGSRPIAFKNAITSASSFESWSRITYRYGEASGNASRNSWTTQSAVGCWVTLQCRILLRPCSMTKKQYSNWNVSVGTVKKSKAAITSRWFCKKANQRCPGSPRPRIRRRYRATVRSEIWKPSFCSSPWIFGAPQPTFSSAIRRMRSRISPVILGRPPRGRDRQRQ